MKKFATAVAVTLLGASLAFAAPNQGGEGHGHGRHHGQRGVFGKKLAQELNITDAQKVQIRDIRKASRQENAAFFEQAKSLRAQFRAAKQANDTAKLDALKAQFESQRATWKQIRAAEEAKIAGVLTAEQNAKWQQLKADRAARREQWKQKHQSK